MIPESEYLTLLDEKIKQLTIYIFFQRFGKEQKEAYLKEVEIDLQVLSSNPYIDEVASQWDAQHLEVLEKAGYKEEMLRFQEELKEKILKI